MKEFLKKDKGFAALMLLATAVLLTDLSYAIFLVVRYVQLKNAVSFLQADIRTFSIVMIALNAALLLSTLVFSLVRRAKNKKQ